MDTSSCKSRLTSWKQQHVSAEIRKRRRSHMHLLRKQRRLTSLLAHGGAVAKLAVDTHLKQELGSASSEENGQLQSSDASTLSLEGAIDAFMTDANSLLGNVEPISFDVQLHADALDLIVSAARDGAIAVIQRLHDRNVLSAASYLLRMFAVGSTVRLQIRQVWQLTVLVTEATAAGGTITADLICDGVITLLFRMISINLPVTVQSECFEALGNLAIDSNESRSAIYSVAGEAIASAVQSVRPGALEHAVRLIAALLCSPNNHPTELLWPALPTVATVMHSPTTESVLNEVLCWGLAHLACKSQEDAQAVLRSGAVESVCWLLSSPQATELAIPSLRVLGNTTGFLSDSEIDQILDFGCLGSVRKLLSRTNADILKEALWTIGNLASGIARHKLAVIEAGLVSSIVPLLHFDASAVKIEAGWIVCHYMLGGSPEQVEYVVELDGLKGVINSLDDIQDPRDAEYFVKSIGRAFIVGQSAANPYAETIRDDVPEVIQLLEDLPSRFPDEIILHDLVANLIAGFLDDDT